MAYVDPGALTTPPPSPPDLAPGEIAVEIAASSMEIRLNASADWSADPSPIGEIKTWLQAQLQCYPSAAVPCQLLTLTLALALTLTLTLTLTLAQP